MPTKEGIREGIAQALGKTDNWYGDESVHNYWLMQADIALNYLHSQGVVLKVEDWLPTHSGMVCTVDPLIETGG